MRPISVSYCCIKNHLKAKGLKPINIYYCIESLVQLDDFLFVSAELICV